ncbi:MAG TPA: glycine cleavage T C-terminal barrel domain-containing protein [Pirellulales bacterium]|jgi:folate-binding protein YgfZ
MTDQDFQQALEENGAVFKTAASAGGPAVFNNGCLLGDPPNIVTSFGDSQAEYKALTEGAGLADFSRRTLIEITGDDRASFLHNLCTNQIRELRPGAGCEAFLTNVQGHVLALVNVLCHDDRFVLETVPDQEAKILAQLDRYLIREKVELLGRSDAWAELLLAGSEAGSLLTSLGCQPPSRLLDHVVAEIGAIAVDVCLVDITIGGGYLLRCERDRMAQLWMTLREAGARPCGAMAVEMARVEAGTPYYGPDISDKNLPQEIARDARAISFVKGCYLGQETVARIDALGHVNRTLVGVRFAGHTVPAPGVEFSLDQKTIGQVTSAVFSPRLASPLALAYVRRGHNNVGTQLQSALGPAEVVSLPIGQ